MTQHNVHDQSKAVDSPSDAIVKHFNTTLNQVPNAVSPLVTQPQQHPALMPIQFLEST